MIFYRLRHVVRVLAAPLGLYCEMQGHWYIGRPYSLASNRNLFLCSKCYVEHTLLREGDPVVSP